MKIFRLAISVAAFGAATHTATAASILPSDPVPLNSLSEFAAPGDNWAIGSQISGDPRNTKSLSLEAGTGIIANLAAAPSGKNLFTSWEHSDIEIDLEFLMPQGSNSGVYLQSRYEVQLFDSWGVEKPTFADCGGIYQRWLQDKKKGYEGIDPIVNASRAPGLWQQLHIVFRAPRFDDSGNKTENAKFIEVSLNGYLLHKNVEVTGPTRASPHGDEKAVAPLMIQGDHGPVAFRNISVKHFGSDKVGMSDLVAELRTGGNLSIGSYDDKAPIKTFHPTNINFEDLGETNNLAATYRGKFQIPSNGAYAFHANSKSATKLVINGQEAIAPHPSGGRSIPIELEAGSHSFRLDYTHGRWTRAALELSVEGPSIPETSFVVSKKANNKNNKKPRELIIEPQDGRIRVQRGFIPHEPVKRLYAISVGSPNGIHYAYDLDKATILHAWNGRFLDTFEMWDGRGSRQVAKPAGPTLTLLSKPIISLVQFSDGDFPEVPDQMWKPEGYTLDANGQPEFHASLAGIQVSDRIVATNDKRGLKRTLTLEGSHTSWFTGVLLAEASTISNQGNGSYIIGDREYYIDVSSDNKVVPFIRNVNGDDQLMFWAPKGAPKTTLTYSLVW